LPGPSRYLPAMLRLMILIQNQERPDGRDEEKKPKNGFGCSLTGRARRGVVRASCVFTSLLGSSTTRLSGTGSATAISGSASDGAGGTHGDFA
jgi:hypothetical protein